MSNQYQRYKDRKANPWQQIILQSLELVLLHIHRIARGINLPFLQIIQNKVEGSPFVIKSNIHQVMTYILVLFYAVIIF